MKMRVVSFCRGNCNPKKICTTLSNNKPVINTKTMTILMKDKATTYKKMRMKWTVKTIKWALLLVSSVTPISRPLITIITTERLWGGIWTKIISNKKAKMTISKRRKLNTLGTLWSKLSLQTESSIAKWRVSIVVWSKAMLEESKHQRMQSFENILMEPEISSSSVVFASKRPIVISHWITKEEVRKNQI